MTTINTNQDLLRQIVQAAEARRISKKQKKLEKNSQIIQRNEKQQETIQEQKEDFMASVKLCKE